MLPKVILVHNDDSDANVYRLFKIINFYFLLCRYLLHKASVSGDDVEL